MLGLDVLLGAALGLCLVGTALGMTDSEGCDDGLSVGSSVGSEQVSVTLSQEHPL